MSSPEPDSQSITREEEEEKIYQLIYEMTNTYSEEEKEKDDIPPTSDLAPAQLKIDDEMSTPAEKQEGTNTKGIDVDLLNSSQGITVLGVIAKEKPWRKTGANISDYFNFGFDEESWNTYCKRQSKLRTANRKLYTKIRAQRGHTKRQDKESSSAYPFCGVSSALSSSRQSPPDVTGGQPGSSGTMERPRCLSDIGDDTQVVTEISAEEDRHASFHLRRPSNVRSLFAYTSPPSVLHRSGSPLSPAAHLDRQAIDGPSTSLYPCSSGISSSVPKSTVSSARMSAAKAWEYCIWQEKYDTDRNRFREHRDDKDSKRGRDKKICSSSHNSVEERMRHRDTATRGHKRSSYERCSGEKEQQRMWRHRGKSEGWRKSSCSGRRRRRDGGEDRDSQNRHTHKKAKRNKDKKTSKTLSTDQERKLKCN